MENKDKKPLVIVYSGEDDLNLELSKEITFIEKLALVTFLRIYLKDLENEISCDELGFKEEE